MGDQVVAAEGSFADDGGGLLFKAAALGGVEVHGGDDENRSIFAFGSGAEKRKEFEAVDVGHHEIEDDDAGADGGAFFEGFGTAGGFVNRPAEAVQLTL